VCVVALRAGCVVFHVGGGLGVSSSDQWNPGHGDPVTLPHELGLGKHATMSRSQTRENTCL
jgi:hypothetical protein